MNISLHVTESFANGIPGFRHNWWARDPGSEAYDYLLFRVGSEEIGRCKVKHTSFLAADYVNLARADAYAEITRFQIRDDRIKEGLGRQAIELVVGQYPSCDLFTFSYDADYFWSKVGWRRFERTDGDDGHMPLFVHQAAANN
ncbi:hypothetical protein [Arthrobacter sp. CJ23]|uniref:hypothetical protein n=1 Tax=Arthrobacter sp. CJ23 TaxID=2972479 RepID=UPI00215D34B9|nr:hypothetical protein [Arthrobacter sp. CJ23]UVJ38032.1 hypothetical protein NVV90_12250 [Arthrobacter sp. CJ23]